MFPLAGVLPLWLAKEAGIFARNGLDVQAVRVHAAVGVMALMSGELQFVLASGPVVIDSAPCAAQVPSMSPAACQHLTHALHPARSKPPNDLKAPLWDCRAFRGANAAATRFALQASAIWRPLPGSAYCSARLFLKLRAVLAFMLPTPSRTTSCVGSEDRCLPVDLISGRAAVLTLCGFSSSVLHFSTRTAAYALAAKFLRHVGAGGLLPSTEGVRDEVVLSGKLPAGTVAAMTGFSGTAKSAEHECGVLPLPGVVAEQQRFIGRMMGTDEPVSQRPPPFFAASAFGAAASMNSVLGATLQAVPRDW